MDTNEWKKKYEITNRELEKLKQTALKVTHDYDDLLTKFQANEQKYEVVSRRLQETEDEFRKLQKLVEPAIGEYQELNSRFQIERGCRTVAEDFATKVTFQNQKLKRQSQQLLDHVSGGMGELQLEDIKRITEEDAQDPEPEEQNKHFNDMIEDLNSQLAALSRQLLVSREEYADALQREEKARNELEKERALREKYEASVNQHQASLHQYKQVSSRAFAEYKDLNDKYEQERELKDKAQTYAAEMCNEKKMMQRQSALILQKNPPSEQLQTALLRIEELEKQLHDEQTHSKKRSSQLEGLLEESQDLARVSELETKLEEATEQITQLEEQMTQMTDTQKQLQTDNEELRQNLQEAENKLSAPPAPPPPPPPPPPLPSAQFFKPLNSIARKKEILTRSVPKSAMQGNDAFTDAMNEMMEKIKNGRTLKSHKERRPSLQENKSPQLMSPAMTELNSIVKRNRSASQGTLSFGKLGVSSTNGTSRPISPRSPAMPATPVSPKQSNSPTRKSPSPPKQTSSSGACGGGSGTHVASASFSLKPSASAPASLSTSTAPAQSVAQQRAQFQLTPTPATTNTVPSPTRQGDAGELQAVVNNVVGGAGAAGRGAKKGNVKGMARIFEQSDGSR